GLNTVILAMGLLPWKIKDMLITGILIYVFYLIPILISDKITDWAIFLNNNFFLVTTLLISLVSSRLGYQQRWREFIAKINLETAYLKLQELDRLKTQFFGNISHELRTPLTLILAPVEMMLKDKEGHLEPHQTKNLNVVRNNALRLLKLMNQLLDLIKIDAGKLELRLSQVKVRDFLREIEDSMSSLAEQKNLKLSFECEESLQSEFDRDQIEKVVMNLIYNAVKFTPEGGSIEVRAKTVKRENTETNS
ncbi:MAG: histidine kinase, partial [Chlamydiae bacterium]|nr:histidine kinase [Chlamydiota bacterium]